MKPFAFLYIALILAAAVGADFALAAASISRFMQLLGFVLITALAIACVGLVVRYGFREDKALRRGRSDTL